MTKDKENKTSKNSADNEQKTTRSKKKYDIDANIPADIFNEINGLCSYLPKTEKLYSKKVVFTDDSIHDIKNTYTMSLFKLEEEIFVFLKEVINMVKRSLELTFISQESKMRFCLVCDKSVSNNLHKFYDHVRCPEHINYLEKTMQNEEHFKLAKQFMKKISNKRIKCYGCNIIFVNTRRASKRHINDETHKQIFVELHKHFNCYLKEIENYWYNIQTYACILCNKIFEYKFNFLQHLYEVHKDTQNITYDFCIPCARLWAVYKDKVTYLYSIHRNLVMHKYLINNQDFMIREMPEHVKEILIRPLEISNKLYKLSENVFQNDLMQQILLKSLNSLLSHQFPRMKLYPFGSRLTGLGFTNSDIDIFIDCTGNNYEQNVLPSLTNEYLDVTKNLLCNDQDNWIVQDTLKQSRTPIIKLKHKVSGLQCDLSFTNGLSVENTKLIRSFNKAFLPCRRLILFAKKWLSLCSLPGRYGITNYALAWLVIFYLQKNEVLPSISTLIKQKNVSRLISGWEAGVDFEIPRVSAYKSFTRLVMEFFEFYDNFDYKNHVACPLIGDFIQKQDFINLSDLPTAMSPYKRYLAQSHNAEMFRIDSLMCLQDPFDLSHNLTRAVQPLTLKAFKQYCRNSADIIRGILND